MRRLDSRKTNVSARFGVRPPDESASDNSAGILQERELLSRLMPSRRSSRAAALELALSIVEARLRIALQDNETLQSRIDGLRESLIDTSRRGLEAHRLAHQDIVTGLPNRLLLIERLQYEIAFAKEEHRQFGLLFIDLDGFKSVNDRRGHIVGDKLLAAVAKRIVGSIRVDDTACRYGGDEFVVLLSRIGTAESALRVASKIEAHISEPYLIDDEDCRVSGSIGFRVYPNDGEQGEELLCRADASMYRSKTAHRQRVHDEERGA